MDFHFRGVVSDAMDIDPEWAFDIIPRSGAAAPEDSLDKAMEQLGYLEKWRSFSVFWTGCWET